MHRFDEKTQELSDAIAAYADDRLKLTPVPLDGVATPAQLQELVGQTITRKGLGGMAAFAVFEQKLAPNCLSTDHPRYLSFIPCAPTREAAMFDLVVGASALYAGSWLEGSGAVYAENQALRWISDLVGLPQTSGGQFVQGGTIGNLSALVAARESARQKSTGRPYRVAATFGSHSSIATACKVMDAELVKVPVEDWQLTGDNLRTVLQDNDPETFFAVVATAGTTNFGIIDDIESVAQVCAEFGIWLHVDGAYGGAGLAAPSVRAKYAGIERCDSFIVDPHKWLFAPFDCCALIYRDPVQGRAAHTQHAGYLDVLTGSDEWNPSDFSIGLTRRARGLPFWFSLAVNGTDAYTEAIERTLEVARFANEQIKARPYLELVREGSLTVVVFRRLGWSAADYQRWSDDLLEREIGFIVPTSHEGETLARFAIVNPLTSEQDITEILDTMA